MSTSKSWPHCLLPSLQIGSPNIGPQGGKTQTRQKTKTKNTLTPDSSQVLALLLSLFKVKQTLSSAKTVVLLGEFELCWRRTVPHDIREGVDQAKETFLGSYIHHMHFPRCSQIQRVVTPKSLRPSRTNLCYSMYAIKI